MPPILSVPKTNHICNAFGNLYYKPHSLEPQRGSATFITKVKNNNKIKSYQKSGVQRRAQQNRSKRKRCPHIFRWDCLSATNSQVFSFQSSFFCKPCTDIHSFLYHFTYCIAIRLQNTLQFQGGI